MNTKLEIRQVGDEILHAAPVKVDFKEINKIQNYISTMMSDSNLYGGVGIACNQCTKIDMPIAIFIYGTNDAKARKAAQKRYPSEIIPYATSAVNPIITRYSKETYYPRHGEGCLSVFGPIRGKVKRHITVTMQYQDVNQNIIEKDYSWFEAHVIQHEYDHLQGIVFLQKIFSDCTIGQKNVIQSLVRQEMTHRKNNKLNKSIVLSTPMMIFERNGDDVIFESQLLSLALTQIPDSTLLGISTILLKNSFQDTVR